MFTRAHKRLPSDQLIFNDVLYKIKTSNEILDPLRVFTSDKEFVKLYVKAIIGDKYNVPTIAVLKSEKEIDSYQFPADCCIKPTQASAKIIFRRNNSPIKIPEIKRWLKHNYYKNSREASYRTLKPKIIIEPLLFNSTDILDFKIFCYEGQPKMIQVDFDRHTNHSRNLYDINWNELPYSTTPHRKPNALKKPENLSEMLEVARKLSEHFNSLVRVDLYNDQTDIYVGELTHCHGNVAEFFYPRSAEIDAPRIIFGH